MTHAHASCHKSDYGDHCIEPNCGSTDQLTVHHVNKSHMKTGEVVILCESCHDIRTRQEEDKIYNGCFCNWKRDLPKECRNANFNWIKGYGKILRRKLLNEIKGICSADRIQ